MVSTQKLSGERLLREGQKGEKRPVQAGILPTEGSVNEASDILKVEEPLKEEFLPHQKYPMDVCHGPLRRGPWPDWNPLLEKARERAETRYNLTMLGVGAAIGIVAPLLFPLMVKVVSWYLAIGITGTLSVLSCIVPAPWILTYLESRRDRFYAIRCDELYFLGFALVGGPAGLALCFWILV